MNIKYLMIRITGFLILVIAAGSLPVLAQQQERGMELKSEPVRALPSKQKRFALVIGVDKYADTQITTLGGSANDARLLADTLVRHAGFPADQVILLSSDQPAERQPTRGNILRRLSNLSAVVPADGLLLFAFAGHGMERGGQAFLLPSDAQLSNDVNLLEQTAVNVTHIKQWVQKTGVKQVLLVLDACRNDPSGRANVDNPLTEAYTRGFNFDVRNREVTAFATIYATSLGHRAYEFREKRHGYFTLALVEGLKGAAANDKGEVTLSKLVSYLEERVPKQVLIDLGKGNEQKPYAVIEGYKANDLVIATTSAAPAPAVDFTKTAEPADAASNSALRDIDNSAQPASAAKLAGTVWSGTNEDNECKVEFLPEGKLVYTLISNKTPIKGRWKQTDSFIQVTIGNYSTLNGTLERGVIKLTGTNREGVKFQMFLTQVAK